MLLILSVTRHISSSCTSSCKNKPSPLYQGTHGLDNRFDKRGFRKPVPYGKRTPIVGRPILIDTYNVKSAEKFIKNCQLRRGTFRNIHCLFFFSFL